MRSATPGPWMVAGEDLPKCVVAASNPSVNLLVWNEHQETVEAASEADARLIAAAPDLAALARQLVTTLDEHLSDGDLRLLRPEAVAQLDVLRSNALAVLEQAGLTLPPG